MIRIATNNIIKNMKTNFKKIITYILGATLVIGGAVFAGLLTPSVNVDTQNFVTIEDIYQGTQHFDYSLPGTHDLSYSSSATGTMHTLKDIKNSLKSMMVPDVADVKAGVSYGKLGSLVGTMSPNCVLGSNTNGPIYTSTTSADKLSPSDSPVSTMVTLEDIYQRLHNFDFSTSSVPDHDLSTSSEPLSSMHTLQDIWDAGNDITFPNTGDVRKDTYYGQASFPRVGTVLEGCPATVPSTINLEVGSVNPVGGVTNVAIPAAGDTDTTGAVTDWVTGTADMIKFIVTDGGSASSAITINTVPYMSGDDYTITSTSSLSIIVTTTEAGKVTGVRTFTVTVEVVASAPIGTMTTYTGTGAAPYAIAFDGINMWTANNGENSVTKITPTGTMTTYTGDIYSPWGIAFDGTNMWITDGNNNVTKISPTGTTTLYPGTGSSPMGIAFDGTNMWTANSGSNSVTKVTPIGEMTTYPLGTVIPYYIAFASTTGYMWVTNCNNNNVTKISPIGVKTTYFIANEACPQGIAFDGTNMWTANFGNNSVTKITSTGVKTTYGIGVSPFKIAFDGTNMWTANDNDNSVTKITPTGTTTLYPGTGSSPIDIAFDGINMWTANADDNSVTKIKAK